MTDKRKAVMFDEVVFYLRELIHSTEDITLTFTALGFTEDEIHELLEV